MSKLSKFNTLMASLGDTKEEVAYNLLRAGALGERQNARCCPVAKFLNKLGWWCEVASSGYVYSRDVQCLDPGLAPSPVVQFIQAFDKGAFDLLSATYSRYWVISLDHTSKKESQ